ncbi:hypothetical protein CC80DRAFT_540247 [Byssothecium circinans]|uniref:F-box domain-containing protein n=1 Tax=Byssothecium circinans TaxID=147558 RepID=A0A6A5TBK7_9PLEO|nr:hypothetical protein CC80DRAFT_540247 [Byssothecium circinans]
MDRLPQELVDEILAYLTDSEHPLTERFANVTHSSQESILSARQVCRCFRDSKTLDDSFITLLEETPLFRVSWGMPTLEALSKSPYAVSMTMLSISGITMFPEPDAGLWDYRFQSYLTDLLTQFTKVKHLRFYPVTPSSLRQSSPDAAKFPRNALLNFLDFPRGPDNEVLITKGEPQYGDLHVFPCVERAFRRAGIELDTLSMPLFGNRSFYCSMDPMSAHWSQSLTRLSVNMAERDFSFIVDRRFFDLQNLEALEIAFSRRPGTSFGHSQPVLSDRVKSEGMTLPRLRDFRLMTDNWHSFDETEFVNAVSTFPNLKSLGLAYIMLRLGLWWGLLSRLKRQHLDRIWLLDPKYVSMEPLTEQVFTWKFTGTGRTAQHGWDVSDMAGESCGLL